MKKLTWDNPNKIHFESDYKTFNRQTNVISTGNVIANTQMSSYIRPWNEVKNGGYIGQPGQFLRFDLQYFQEVPESMIKRLYDKSRAESYCLYEFFVTEDGKRKIIGHVLTDYNHNLIDWSVNCYYGQSYWKRESAIRECMEYICA